jgi:hypothetical protein
LLQIWHRLGSTKIPRTERGYCTSLLYSDDHGESWHTAKPIGQALCCNESRLCETKEGLLWTLRAFDMQHAYSRSSDGGQSWSEPCVMPLPPANVCDAGLLALQEVGAYADTVLFSRITSTEKGERKNLEICLSTDGGQSFPQRFFPPAGDAMPGYSDLCLIDGSERTVGLVHCRADHVLFSRISLQTLTNGAFDGTERSVWKSV